MALLLGQMATSVCAVQSGGRRERCGVSYGGVGGGEEGAAACGRARLGGNRGKAARVSASLTGPVVVKGVTCDAVGRECVHRHGSSKESPLFNNTTSAIHSISTSFSRSQIHGNPWKSGNIGLSKMKR